MKKYSIAYLCFIVLFFGLQSCTEKNREGDKRAGCLVAEEFFKLRMKNETEKTYPFFDEKFLEVSPVSTLDTVFRRHRELLGNLKSYKLEKCETSINEYNSTGDYKMEYATVYEKDAARELFHMVKRKKGSIKILSYRVNSNAFKD